MPRLLTRLLTLLLGTLCIPFAALAQAKAPPEAEQAAKTYMSAFYNGNFQSAADLAAPETIDRVRDLFFAELAKVVGTGKEKGFLAHQGVARPVAELKTMTPRALYALLAEGRQRRDPKVLEAMKATQVEIVGSEMTTGGGAIVRLRIKMPEGIGPPSHQAALALRLVSSEWKVVANAP